MTRIAQTTDSFMQKENNDMQQMALSKYLLWRFMDTKHCIFLYKSPLQNPHLQWEQEQTIKQRQIHHLRMESSRDHQRT